MAEQNLGPREPNDDMVICPNCTCQFVAVPVNRQSDVPESTVREFIGWLSADVPALHQVEVPKLADSWERFKERKHRG